MIDASLWNGHISLYIVCSVNLVSTQKYSLITICHRPTKRRLRLLFFLQQALYDWTRSGSTEAISSTTTKWQRCDHEAEAEVDASSEVLGAKDHKAKWERAVKQRTTGYHFSLNLEYEYNENRTAIIKDVWGHCKMCLHTCKFKCQQCDVFLCLKKGDSPKDCWSDFQ